VRSDTLTITTRKSRLALWQTEHVAGLLRRAHPDINIELLPLSTRGDEVLDRSLAEIGGKGLFLKELETALVDGRADLAVHSLKDVPACMPGGLALVAYLERANPADLWITRDGVSIEALAPGSRVGSSSLRRISQLRALRDDLVVEPLRGNVETRMAAVREGRFDATILAAAGLERLDVVPAGALELDTAEWLPAPGQGVVAVEARAGDARVTGLLAVLDCAATRARALCERAVVERLGGDCRMPLAALAECVDGRLQLRARLGDGRGRLLDAACAGGVDRPAEIGHSAAGALLDLGGDRILKVLNRSQN